jgi:hypothetical protein
MKNSAQAFDLAQYGLQRIIHPIDPLEEQQFQNTIEASLSAMEVDVNRAANRGQVECLSEIPTNVSELRSNAIIVSLLSRLRILGYTADVVKSEYRLLDGGASDNPTHINHTTFKLVWGKR